MSKTKFFDTNINFKAYRNIARDVHPDKNPSPEAAAVFHKLKEAFDFLKEPQNRAKLDMHLDNWRKQQER
jgi:DnaJ family protein C protein 17